MFFFKYLVTLLALSPSLDVDVQSPDEKSVITYVSTLYDAFPKVPDGVDGISPNVSEGISSAASPPSFKIASWADRPFFFFPEQDVDIKWVEYQNMIKYLSQWIKHNVAIMSDRSFPNNPVELKVLMISTLIMNFVLNIRAKKISRLILQSG